MAQKMQVLLLDDIDGGDASETVSFSLDGVGYEIDLNDENAGKLRDALSSWVGHARKTSGRSTGGARRPRAARSGAGAGAGAGAGSETAEVRAWAKENGHTVSERGRIPGGVLDAYRAAHDG